VPFGNRLPFASMSMDTCPISIIGMRMSEIRMKVKNILTILAVLVAAFIYPELTLWLVPLVISITTLIKFGRNDIAKYISFLSLKPIFVWVLFWLASDLEFLERFYAPYSLAIAPEILLTLIIVYSFKHVFRREKLTWLFLIGDVIRWVSLFIESLLPDPIPEPYFYTQFYVWVFFLLIFPSLYAVIGLISARDRFLNERVAL
jgi:hypothetical protein